MYLADHDTNIPWACEQVGILGPTDFANWTGILKKDYLCNFTSTDDVQAFHCWILNYRPNLVLMEVSALEKASRAVLDDLKATLTYWGIHSLILCQNLDQIHQLRNEKWPHVHFICAPFEAADFQERILYLLMERYLITKSIEEIMLGTQVSPFLLHDCHTGLVTKPILVEVVREQMDLAGKRADMFSLVRFHLTDLKEYERHFGGIFSIHLVSNLAFFVKNRVRFTDFVGLGEKGEVWVLLPRCDSYVANLVADRITSQFREASTFGEGDDHFKPSLTSQAYTFPHDFNSPHELLSLFEATQAGEILKPLFLQDLF